MFLFFAVELNPTEIVEGTVVILVVGDWDLRRSEKSRSLPLWSIRRPIRSKMW
jgi:hypothetical protein